jgi:hypothetical protein
MDIMVPEERYVTRRVGRRMIHLPRSVSTIEEMNQLAPYLVKREYGPGTFISQILNMNEENQFTFKIGVKTPIQIEDNDGIHLAIRTIPNIEEFTFKRTDSGRLSYQIKPYEVFEKSLVKKNVILFQTLERELIKNTFESIARIPQVANTLTPLMEIANTFRFEDKIGRTRLLNSRKKKQQMMNYIKFMSQNGFIDVKKDVVYPTNRLLKYLNNNPHDISIHLMGDMLKRGYSDMMTFLHLSGLKPYLTLANAYYTPASEAKELLRMAIKNLRYHYRILYRKDTNSVKLRNQVSMMSEVDIFSIDNKAIIGMQNILDKQMNLLNEITSVC